MSDLTLSQIVTNQAAARTLFGALVNEYSTAAEQGKLKEWREAVCAIAELLAPSEDSNA